MTEEYQSFVDAVRNIVKVRTDHYNGEERELARAFAKTVFEAIGSQGAIDAIDYQSKQQDPRVLEAFTAELKFFNARYGLQERVDQFGRHQDPEYSPRATDASAVGDAETVKESLRKIFTLPAWFDKALEILDELLSLVK